MLTTSPTLLEKLRQPREEAAWGQFVQLYTPLLHHWAARQGFQPADAADLTQDVLVKLVHEMRFYQRSEGQSFRGWLFRIVANQAHDFRRRKATRPLPQADLEAEPAAEAGFSALEEAEYRQLLVNRVLEVIRADFDDSTWFAFAGLMQQGRPAADVARDLHITPNAVYLARIIHSKKSKSLSERLKGY